MLQEVDLNEITLSNFDKNAASTEFAKDAQIEVSLKCFEPNFSVNVFGITPQQLSTITEHRSLYPFPNVSSIAHLLQSDSNRGIYTDDPTTIKTRQKIFGTNTYPTKHSNSLFIKFFHSITQFHYIFLGIVAVFNLVFGIVLADNAEASAVGWIQGAVIILAIGTIAMTTAFLSWISDHIWTTLLKENEKCTVRLLRQGQHLSLPIQEIVVGDVVELQTGEQVPADGLVLEQSEALQIDECAMSKFSSKEVDPFLLAGTKVMQGNGKMLVTAVGLFSQFGKTLPFLHSRFAQDTPFLHPIHKFTSVMIKAGLLSATIKFVVLILGWLIRKFVLLGKGIPTYDAWKVSDLNLVLEFVIICCIVYSLATPHTFQFIPAVVAYRMFKSGLLLRNPKSVEIANKLNTLCIGETVLLDQTKQPKVVEAIIGGNHFANSQLAHFLQQNPSQVSGDVLSTLAESIALNSTANLIVKPVTKNKKEEEWIIQGSMDEGALLLFLKQIGIDYNSIRQQFISKFQAINSFSPATKSMTTIVEQEDGTFRKYTKGAIDFLLPQCNFWLDATGQMQQFSLQQQQDLMAVAGGMAGRGLRTLCTVYSDANRQADFVFQETKVILIGILALDICIEKHAKSIIKNCQKSGIEVKLVTGDHLLTANHLAKTCGILQGEGFQLEASHFRNIPLEHKKEVVPQLKVLARCTAQDKHDLFDALHCHEKLYVAITCKTHEDATICQKTDIGISLQKSGTQVVKEVSDWVLLNDSFLTLFEALQWSRAMYYNLKKFMCFQLSTSLVLLLYLFATSVVNWFILPYALIDRNGYPSEHILQSFGPVQLLRIKFIEEGFICIAYALEPPLQSLLRKPPQPHRGFRKIIDYTNWFIIIVNAVYQFTCMIVLQYAGIYILQSYYETSKGYSFTNEAHWNRMEQLNTSMVYHTFILCTLVSIVVFRQVDLNQNSLEGIWRNPFLLLSMLSILVIETVIVVIPWNPVFETRQLDWPHWILSTGIALLMIPFVVLMKAIARLLLRFKNFWINHLHCKAQETSNTAVHSNILPV